MLDDVEYAAKLISCAYYKDKINSLLLEMNLVVNELKTIHLLRFRRRKQLSADFDKLELEIDNLLNLRMDMVIQIEEYINANKT